MSSRRLDPHAPLTDQLEALLAPSLNVLWERSPALSEVNAYKSLHRLRLAAKAARYGSDRFGDVLPDVARYGIKATRRLQNRLGAVHDADLQCERLRGVITKRAKRSLDALGKRAGPGAADPALADAARDVARDGRQVPLAGLAEVLADLVEERADHARRAAVVFEKLERKGGRRAILKALRAVAGSR